MKRLLIIAFLLITLPCYALTYTYTLTNGTTADADEVMQNFNDAKDEIENLPGSQITDNTISNSKISTSAQIDATKIEGSTTDVNLQVFATNYRKGVNCMYEAAGNMTVTAGEIMINGKFRRNTSSTDSAWTPASTTASGLDTGSEAASTQYYVWACADDPNASTFTVVPSTSPSAPAYSGATNYRLIGQFYNDGSSNINSVQDRGTSELKIATGKGTGTGAAQVITVGFQPVYVKLFRGDDAIANNEAVTIHCVTQDMDIDDLETNEISASDVWGKSADNLYTFTTTGFTVNHTNGHTFYYVCYGY